MPAPRSHGLTSPTICALIVVAMLTMIVIPAAITLHSVRIAAPPIPLNQGSTPHGYTISLLLFIVPITFIAIWFLPSEGLRIPQRAFWWTMGILVPLGCLLDFVFAQWFFDYPNVGATLGIPAPALGRPVPFEEYVFYLTGFLAVLLLYVWLGEFWLATYNVIDYPSEAKRVRRLLHFHPTSLILAAVLIGAAWFYKKHLALPEEFSGRVPRLLYIPGCRGFPSGGFLFPGSTAFHQLARPQPHAFLYVARQLALGGHAGCSLPVVGIPAQTDDRIFYRRLVWSAHRRGLCLDRSDLCHGNNLRSSKSLACIRTTSASGAAGHRRRTAPAAKETIAAFIVDSPFRC